MLKVYFLSSSYKFCAKGILNPMGGQPCELFPNLFPKSTSVYLMQSQRPGEGMNFLTVDQLSFI